MNPLFSACLSLLAWICGFGLAAGAFAQTPAGPSAAAPKLKTLRLTCRVLYEPSRALWVRELEIDYDRKAFQALRIDGVTAHGFAAEAAVISTHLDNERIYLDLSAPSWKSEFRDAAQGQGACVKNR